VRQSHFFELLSSMLLFGGIAGWVLYGKRQEDRQAQIAKATQKPIISAGAR
jgi:hypothetical protein